MSSAEVVRSLADEPRLARIDFRSVRAWILGEALSPEAGWAFEAATGLDLCHGFAPEGVAGLAACNPINGRRVDGSIGLPLPGVELRFPDGSRAPDDGMLGPLEIRGPNVAAEGWIRAASVVRLDPVGFLHLPSVRP
jgi:acyl-CoA synthetase (AMP-forming)/AMP-acid ligase II